MFTIALKIREPEPQELDAAEESVTIEFSDAMSISPRNASGRL
jgi:hypothetical protein